MGPPLFSTRSADVRETGGGGYVGGGAAGCAGVGEGGGGRRGGGGTGGTSVEGRVGG